eukprot:1128518-Karenia_brevis.AAC.1
MGLYSKIDGYVTSSTRSELLGLIISMLCPMPIHNALDNLAVVNKANLYLEFMLKHPDAPPP